ncbi:MAG TPA: hypothetical protein VKX35_02665 [Fermentimonas sp.]|nr:hypothetical protein [Fermentimonas sp.]
MQEFEFLTARHEIPTNQLIAYFAVLAIIYILFLRVKRWDTLTSLILLMFIQGFFLAFGTWGMRIFKIVFTALSFILVYQARRYPLSKNDIRVVFLFSVFSVLYLISWFINDGFSFSFAGRFYHYLIPFLLFIGIKNNSNFQKRGDYYARLVVTLLIFQIIFSIAKIVILGIRENIIGSLGTTGGAISVTYALMGLVIYWLYRGEKFTKDDWIFVLFLLVIPIASNKRGIWFMYPPLLGLLLIKNLDKKLLSKLVYLIILVPFLIYFGIRLNPSLNPDRVLWGSFDPMYTYDYVMQYTTGEGRNTRGLGYGRLGTNQTIYYNLLNDPLSRSHLLGYGDRTIKYDEEFDIVQIGITEHTTIAGLGQSILGYGYIATLILVLLVLKMISSIRDPYNRFLLGFWFLFDFIIYTGGFIRVATHSFIFVFAIVYASYRSRMRIQINGKGF